MADEQSPGVEIEPLTSRVRVEALGELHLDAAQLRLAGTPRLELGDLDTRLHEEAREVQVVPHRVSGEVGRVERVPPQVPPQPGAAEEGLSRIPPGSDDLTSLPLQPSLAALEHAPKPRLRERIHDRARLVQVHGQAVVREAV